MGEAKRRSRLSTEYGQPAVYLLELFEEEDKAGDLPLLELLLPIKPRPKQLLANKDGLAMSGVILAYFIVPTQSNWDAVEQAIFKYCSRLDAVPDWHGMVDAPERLPERWWAWLRQPDGDIVLSRDNTAGSQCKVIFASRDGVAPEQPGVKMQSFQGRVFEKQLLESA